MGEREMNKGHYRPKQYAVFGMLLTLLPWEVFASASQSAGQRPIFGGGLLIAWIIAFLSRRRAIGGWLLYFYIQLYFSFLVSLLLLTVTF